jgi:branched-chain amino acid transport system substrate-binding protein
VTNSKKTLWRIAVAIVAIVILFLLFEFRGASPNTFDVGLVSFLTGPSAAYGQISANALKLAVEDINSAGGIKGKKLNIIAEDYGYDQKRVVPAYESLKSRGIKFFFIEGSGAAATLAPLIKKDGNFSMVPTATSIPYKDGSPLTCRIALTADDYGPAIANLIVSKFPKAKVAFLMPNNETGQGIMKKAIEKLNEAGIPILDQELFDPSTGDVRTQTAKLKALGNSFGILVLSNLLTSVEPMLKQIRELGLNKQVVTDNWTAGNPALSDISLLNGAYFVDYMYNSNPQKTDSTGAVSFKQEYFKTYGVYPPLYAAVSYDAMKVVANGLNNSGNQNPYEVAQYLIHDMGEYPGISGPFRLNDDCEVSRISAVRQIVGGKIID